MAKTYYSRNNDLSDSYRLSPAPQLSIKTEPYYSGDVIIGYTYIVSLRGYATTYKKTSSSTDPTESLISISRVVDNISIVKTILTRNGSDLTVTENDGATVFKAKGGTLKSLSFNESPNNWSGYSEYSAEIEFNEIEMVSGTALSTIQCSSSYLDGQSLSSNIVDIDKYKLKTFTDTWSFNIDDLIYNRVKNTEIGQDMDTDNSRISITYTISATGKNFYVNGNLLPAWEQAKNFAQDRLYKQVTSLLTSAMGITGDTACSASASLNNIAQSTDGLINTFQSLYGIYNETISCQTSESDGTFSATYNAILKRNNTSSTNHPASIHTFNKSINTQRDPRNNISITVQGNIEGLIPGGVILNGNSGFRLPQNGEILISATAASKHTNALTALAKIISGNDLSPSIKTKLGINATTLGLIGPEYSGCSISNIKPASFNLTHNYHEGTISYSIEYNSIIACGGGVGSFSSISISTDDPVPVLAEMPIPGTGVLIQPLNTYTAKKINITIEGRTGRDCCLTSSSILQKIRNASTAGIPDNISLPDENSYVLVQKQRSDNPIDGSYSINLSYICKEGCGI